MTGGRIMGSRLHFATLHKVEFASTEMFKYKTYEFHRLLDALEVGYSGEAFDEEFECPADEWARGLRRLQDGDFSEDVRKALDGFGTESPEDIIYAMSLIAERSDTSDGFIHLAFF
jgi:hypothetical protein